MNALLDRILTWFQNPCRFGHKWFRRKGNLYKIRSADRGLEGEILVKNPDGGWFRYHRYCVRCLHSQYLKQETPDTGCWKDM